MDRIIEIFQEIVKLPHCSHQAEALKIYIRSRAKTFGFEVYEDEAGNLLCKRNSSPLCLQAHYDMVCIGRAHAIEMIKEDGWLKAKDSTLGADNGIGVAIMLALMEEGWDLEYLFTADEEVGLVGAKNLSLDLSARYLLNLDSEKEGEVTIGCAGGIDLYATLPLSRRPVPDGYRLYRVAVSGLPGGHSGIDIDKNIPCAIKELSYALLDIGGQLVSIEGGERINAIASDASAIIATAEPIEREFLDQNVQIVPISLEECKEGIIVEGEKIIKMLAAFAHGVRAYSPELKIPQASINLAMVRADGLLQISLSARAMDDRDLRRMAMQTRAFFEGFGLKVRTEGKYPPWKPKKSDFAELVREVLGEFYQSVDFVAIHAGLETAILQEKFPYLQIASVGPTILYPHSIREMVEISSVQKVYQAVKEIAKRVVTFKIF